MRISYSLDNNSVISKVVIRETNLILFNFDSNKVSFSYTTKSNGEGDLYTVHYKIEDARKMHNQMLKDGYLDLTNYNPYRKTLTLEENKKTYDLIDENGKSI